jgi:hypothetical protein
MSTLRICRSRRSAVFTRSYESCKRFRSVPHHARRPYVIGTGGRPWTQLGETGATVASTPGSSSPRGFAPDGGSSVLTGRQCPPAASARAVDRALMIGTQGRKGERAASPGRAGSGRSAEPQVSRRPWRFARPSEPPPRAVAATRPLPAACARTVLLLTTDGARQRTKSPAATGPKKGGATPKADAAAAAAAAGASRLEEVKKRVRTSEN